MLNLIHPQRARRKSTVKLWRKIVTRENKKWTKKYHDKDPKKKCFGGKVIIKMKNGKTISEEINVADAHPAGKNYCLETAILIHY